MEKSAPFWSRLGSRYASLSPVSLPYLFALVAISLSIRLVVAFYVYGTDDMTSWIGVSRLLNEGKNPYESGRLNWPPLWPALILYSSRLAAVYGLPLHFAIKLAPIAADTGLAWIIYAWKLRSSRPPEAFRFGLWMALNPVSIGTSAAGGQFDSIAALFGTLAVVTAHDMWPAGEGPRHGLWRVLIPAFWLGLGGFAK